MVEKVSAFFVGNVVGLALLVGGVLLTAPKKLKETEIIQKQQAALKEQAQQASSPDVKAATDEKKPAPDMQATTDVKKRAPYVVAKVNIARGEKIGTSTIRLEELTTEGNQDALSDVKSAVGKTTIIDIPAGVAITTKALKH